MFEFFNSLIIYLGLSPIPLPRKLTKNTLFFFIGNKEKNNANKIFIIILFFLIK